MNDAERALEVRKRIVGAMGGPNPNGVFPENCLDWIYDPEIENLLIFALAIRPLDFELRMGQDDASERGQPPEGDFEVFKKEHSGWIMRIYSNSVIELWPLGPGASGAGPAVFWRPEEVKKALDAQEE